MKSMMENTLRTSIQIVMRNSESERQLGQMILDLLDICGDDPSVVRYLNHKSAEMLNQ